MEQPQYVDLSGAREVLAELGIVLTERQMKRAAEADVEGKRKFPFFLDPIERKLKIEKNALTRIYNDLQKHAYENTKHLNIN